MVEFSAEEFENVVVGGRYRLVSLLGEGAMGNVFLAEDEYLKRQVAIKVLRDEWGGRADVLKRLENECRLMAHLGQHPNIVMLLDRIVENSKTLLIMEYASGEPLSKIIQRTLKIQSAGGEETGERERDESLPLVLTPELSHEIAIQCLRALDYAHSRGVLHLDIKPSNIMIHRDNLGQITAKLMDFGIGQTRADTILESAVTALTFTDGAGLGTPAYMAPEQIDPERFGPPGPSADVYSLGATLFEMVTLRLPFVGAYTEVLHAHANTRPPNPRDINPEVSLPMARTILTALRKSPGNRYHSAEEMLEELKGGHVSDQQEQKVPGGSPEEGEGRGDRHKLFFKASLRVVMLSLLLLFVITFWWLEWQLPWSSAPFLAFIQEGGITTSQARDGAAAARSTAEEAHAPDYAAEFWVSAETLFEQAEKQDSADTAVRLFLQAQEHFEKASELADIVLKDRERKGEKEPGETEEEAPVTPEPPLEEETITEINDEEMVSASGEEKDVDAQEEETRSDRLRAGSITTIPLGADVYLELVWVPSGTFTMGAEQTIGPLQSGRGRQARQSQARDVWLPSGFWMGRTLITQAQWVRIMGSNPSKFKSAPDLPVDSVSWHDAQQFVARLNRRMSGGGFRLPTEAEWEYAARAGVKTAYYGGYTADRLSEYAWHSGNSGGQTRPVGSKRANAWGLYDMLGNLWEWVDDWYAPLDQYEGPYANPTGPQTGIYKVLRGGAWSFRQDHCSLNARTSSIPQQGLDVYGFRVVRQP